MSYGINSTNEMGGACSAYWGEERCVHGFGAGRDLRERGKLGDPGVDGRILRLIFRKWDVGVWNGSNWLRIGTGGGHL